MNRRTVLLGLLAIALPVCISAGARPASADVEEIVVIVHKSNGVPPMNRSQLSAIFKAKSTPFPAVGAPIP